MHRTTEELYKMKGEIANFKVCAALFQDGQKQFSQHAYDIALKFMLENSNFIQEAINKKIDENIRNNC